MKLKPKFTLPLLWIFLLIMIIAGCKKDRPQQNGLVGDWIENSSSVNAQRIGFSKNGEFYTHLPGANLNELMTLRGTYSVKENNLEITIKERQVISSGNSINENTIAPHGFYENCTFSIENDVLTLKYTTYPADAPMETEQKFQRAHQID